MREPDSIRQPTAGRLLTIWKKVGETEKDAAVRGLLCNAGVLAESCFFEGERLFESAEAVLETLTVREMERLLERLAGGEKCAGGESNPGFDAARFQRMRGSGA